MKTHLAAVCIVSVILAMAPFGIVRGAAEPTDGKAPVKLELLGDQGTPWKIPDGTTKLTVLAVGGGGSGAPGLGNAGGGGGAGGLVLVDDYLTKYNAKPGLVVQVKIGMPGAIQNLNQARRGFAGEDTIFGKINALGGGGGGRGRNDDPIHHASSGGSAGGGTMGDKLPEALQPSESGIGVGFGNPGGGALDQTSAGAGANGGGAGGPGTSVGKGGGGTGLQGVPKPEYIDPKTGFVTKDFDAENPAHYRLLFRDVFGPGIGEDGWFAGGGANNSRAQSDKGGRGGGSTYDGLPHTGGGGGGSTHGYRGSDPGVGGTGVVLVRCQFADGRVQVYGWGHTQPDEFISRRALKDATVLWRDGKYEQALQELANQDPDKLPKSVQVEMLRIYGQIYAATGNEEEALAKFKQAVDLENN